MTLASRAVVVPHERCRLIFERRLARTSLEMSPLRDDDYRQIYQWSISPKVARTWMYRGSTPSFDDFMRHLFVSVLAQFVFLRNGEAVAVGALYDANHNAGHAALRILVAPDQRHPFTGVDSFALLSQFAFSTFPFSRLFLQTNSVSLQQFRSAVQGGYFVEEARLHNYERLGEEWVDMVYFSFSRSLLVGQGAMSFQVSSTPTGSTLLGRP